MYNNKLKPYYNITFFFKYRSPNYSTNSIIFIECIYGELYAFFFNLVIVEQHYKK